MRRKGNGRSDMFAVRPVKFGFPLLFEKLFQAQQRAEEERRRREAETERPLRDEADPKRRPEAKERRGHLWRSAVSAVWPPSRPALLVASLLGLAALGAIAVCIVPRTLAPSAPEPVP